VAAIALRFFMCARSAREGGEGLNDLLGPCRTEAR
jgi:hypothetical protein